LQLRCRDHAGHLQRRLRQRQQQRLVVHRALRPAEGRELDPDVIPSAEIAADLAALREGAALIERSGEILELTGPDRLRLLNGLVTADVKTVAPGSVASGFFTSGQGRILADFRLFARDESCSLLLPEGTGESIRAHLEKYKVASRVEIARVGEGRCFELRGRGLESDAAAPPLSGLRAAESEAAATFTGEGGLYLLLKALPDIDLRVERWVATGSLGLRRVGARAVEIARIEDGELRFGIDFSGENFPQETGREKAVSYTKGCYLGQEVVARIHYRGGVQRHPRGLRFLSGEMPEAGATLLVEGRPVGRATSSALSPRFGAIGLAVVHQRGAAPGTRLEVEGGGGAEVEALPFGSAT
jgi:folate-binding protein YgfZ